MDTILALPPRILVVEADQQVARLLHDRLCALGYAVLVAANADEALTHLATVCPTLIILDLALPGISGRTLLRMLRADRDTEAIPVLLTTVQAHLEFEIRALAHGVLKKPVVLDDLVARVQQLIGAPQLQERTVNV